MKIIKDKQETNMSSEEAANVVYVITKPYIRQKIMGPLYKSSVVRRFDENRFFFVTLENKVVGYLLWKRYKKEPYFLLEKMATSIRNKGIGKKLFLALEEIAIKEKRNIRLRVAKVNENGINFYKKNGFRFVEEETDATYTMEKVLFESDDDKKSNFIDKEALKMPMIVTNKTAKKNKKGKVDTQGIIERNSRETQLTEKKNDPKRYGTDYVIRYKDTPLTVKNIFNMSEEKKEEVAEFLFSYFRKNGFPYPTYTDEECQKDWQKLCDFDVDSIFDEENKIISAGSTVGNLIFKTYSPHFFAVKEDGKKSRSMLEAFNDDETLKNVIRNRLGITFYYRGVSHPFTMTGNMLKQGFRSMRIVPATSNFRPTVAKCIYKKFLPNGGMVYDFSSGFNQRLLGAMSCENIKYVGVDPWGDTFLKGREIISKFNFANRASLFNKGSEEFSPNKIFDLAFSSPPYFTKEVYSKDESQAYNRDYDYFINYYWDKTIKNIFKGLKNDGVFIFNVCRKHKKYNILDDMKNMAEKNGFNHIDTYYMKFSKSHLSGKVGTDNLMKLEPFLVFKKI